MLLAGVQNGADRDGEHALRQRLLHEFDARIEAALVHNGIAREYPVMKSTFKPR